MWSGVIISVAGDGEKNVPRTARTHLLAEVRTHARCVAGCLIVWRLVNILLIISMTKLGPGSIKTEKVYRVYIFMSIIKNRSLHSTPPLGLGPKFPGFYNSLSLAVIRKFYLLQLDIYSHHYLVLVLVSRLDSINGTN